MLKIKIDDIKSVAVKNLLQEHHEDMLKHSPIESVHALDFSALKAPNVTFYTAWVNNELAGCAALKALDDKHVELKSMKTSNAFLRKGIAGQLLMHLLTIAAEQTYEKMSLETGTADAFIPAQKLYEQFNFFPCKPFSEYKEDPYSIFFTKYLVE